MRPALLRQRITLCVAILLWCAFLVWLRWQYKAEPLFASLWWNLFLAAIPLVSSTMMRAAVQRRLPYIPSLCFIIWLLFLPNAPYILTDFFHLQVRDPVPIWLDLAILLAFSGAGLICCYLSLADVQALVRTKYGATAGWTVVTISMLLCGLGIHFGRYLRLNSWQLITHPWHIFHKTVLQFGVDPRVPNPLTITLVYGTALLLGYWALHVFAALMQEIGPDK